MYKIFDQNYLQARAQMIQLDESLKTVLISPVLFESSKKDGFFLKELERLRNCFGDENIAVWYESEVGQITEIIEKGKAYKKLYVCKDDTSSEQYFLEESGLKHREYGPAEIYSDGDFFWWLNGKLHRESGPAEVRKNGAIQKWYLNGLKHRDGGPASEFYFKVNGAYGSYKEWYLNDVLHNEKGYAIEYKLLDTNFYNWYKNGKLHREDGPAEETSWGTKGWWLDGKKHREDGPAIERANFIYNEFWINGQKFSKEEFQEKQKNIWQPLKN